jgi:hypothetical protein
MKKLVPTATDCNTNAKKKPTLKKTPLLIGWMLTGVYPAMSVGTQPILKATKVRTKIT